jgi:hypothetical protein
MSRVFFTCTVDFPGEYFSQATRGLQRGTAAGQGLIPAIQYRAAVHANARCAGRKGCTDRERYPRQSNIVARSTFDSVAACPPESKSDSLEGFVEPGVPTYQPQAKSTPESNLLP